MHEPTRSETQHGLAALRERFTARGIAILEQHRRWPERLATYFAIGNTEYRTDIVIPDTFLDDLPNTKEHQAALDSYASAVAGRIKCGSPEVLFCLSGTGIRVEIQWPIQSAMIDSVISTWILTNVTNQTTRQVAKVALRKEFSFNRTPFDDVKSVATRIRRAIDKQRITFYPSDVHQDTYQQIERSSQEKPQQQRPKHEIERFIASKAYVLGFLAADGRDGQVWAADPWDAEYLGVGDRDLRLAARTLRAQELVELDSSFEYARPTDKLLARESAQEPEAPAVQKLSRLDLPTKETLLSDIQPGLAGEAALAVVVIDLDNFKQLNDTRGHLAGDECLDRVVNTIGTILGRRGKLYRWGAGDEFVAVLPDVSTGEAQATAERIRTAIEQDKTGGDIQVTSSIGVCATDLAKTKSAKDFLDFADQAMYKSKQSGRNCVTTWG